MISHYVKCHEKYFKSILSGSRRFRVHVNGPMYKVGDTVFLRECKGYNLIQHFRCISIVVTDVLIIPSRRRKCVFILKFKIISII